MNKFRITLDATALALAAVAIVACSKEKTAQQETTIEQQLKVQMITPSPKWLMR
ncbi:MAG: hypothetical protein Q4F82_12115 [bacterium]|nr:hypothetical protein [bacterium]